MPTPFAQLDWDFLAVTLGFAVGLCVLTFASGWWVARLFRAELAQRVSLMFGLGMNNNGTGLVLASLALSHLPQVMLPIIFYNLVQHLVTGGVTAFLVRRPAFGGGRGGSSCGGMLSRPQAWGERTKSAVTVSGDARPAPRRIVTVPLP